MVFCDQERLSDGLQDRQIGEFIGVGTTAWPIDLLQSQMLPQKFQLGESSHFPALQTPQTDVTAVGNAGAVQMIEPMLLGERTQKEIEPAGKNKNTVTFGGTAGDLGQPLLAQMWLNFGSVERSPQVFDVAARHGTQATEGQVFHAPAAEEADLAEEQSKSEAGTVQIALRDPPPQEDMV